MATTIKLKNSVTTTNAPSSLAQGEVAINITDKKVWVGNAATTPIQLLGDGGSGSFTSIAFGAGTVSSPSITFTGDTNTGIYSPAADTIAFTEGGVEAMRIDSSGNVGIGTSSPVGKLNVYGASGGRYLTLDAPTNGGYATFQAGGTAFADIGSYLAITGSGNATDFFLTTRNYPLIFGSNSTERMRITSAGVLVINSSAPETTISGGTPIFQVTGSGFNAIGAFTRRQNDANGSALCLAKSRNTSANSYTVVQNGDTLGAIIFIGDDGTDLDTYGAVISAQVDGTPGANDMPGRLVFSTTADGAATVTERMRITSAGNVGIGTSSPASLLDVTGNDPTIRLTDNAGSPASTWSIRSTDGNFAIRDVTNSSDRATFNANGCMALTGANLTATGIGITFPATQSASSNANTLDDYEEGTWTPIDSSGASLSFSTARGNYTKIGRQVICTMVVTYPSTASGSSALIGGLPFTAANPYSGSDTGFGGYITYSSYDANFRLFTASNSTTVTPYNQAGTAPVANSSLSTRNIQAVITYFV